MLHAHALPHVEYPNKFSSASRFPKQSATQPGGVELISRSTADAYKLCTFEVFEVLVHMLQLSAVSESA